MIKTKEPPLNHLVERMLADPPPRRRGKGRTIHLDMTDLAKSEEEEFRAPADDTLSKSLGRALDSQPLHRLAFTTDPGQTNVYASLYRPKSRLIPDKLLKRIAIQDDLVACIVQARQNQVSQFGRPRPDRHSNGFVIEPKQATLEAIEKVSDEKGRQDAKENLLKQVAAATKRFMTCGDPEAKAGSKLTFPQYLSESARNALVVGRFATEICREEDPVSNQPKFRAFRVVDAGTIYKTAPKRSGSEQAAEDLRRQSRDLLEKLSQDGDIDPIRLDVDRYDAGEYSWVQVIEDRPWQAFTDKELLVQNFYHVPDVELDGYPVTPLDTAISAVTTHINITTHNKLYFQHGRAARGMLVIKSEDADDAVVARVRQQFNASINNVNNSWRMPVFSVGPDEDITWQPIDSGGRDMEFQYLSDSNARTILSAFQMSPEELPGWAYLSRGTNSQALSESNNEYRLEAHRDLGIRPLLARFEDFVNQELLPLVAPDIADKVVFKLVGLDAETPEKEDTRLAQAQNLHMSYDEILQKVDKKPIGKRWGGEYPLNPGIQAVLDKLVTVAEQRQKFLGIEDTPEEAARWNYCRDPYYWQNLQRMDAIQQAQAQAQQQQQGGGPPGGPSGDSGGQSGAPGADGGDQGGEAAGPPDRAPQQTQKQQSEASDPTDAGAVDLSRSVDQALEMLSKSEDNLPTSRRRMLARHNAMVKAQCAAFMADASAALAEVLGAAASRGSRSKIKA